MKATLEGKSGTSTLSLAHLSFRQLISDFNENRKQNVAASTKKVFNESMSAFLPQTTKSGN